MENFPDSQELQDMTTHALDALRSAQTQLHEQIDTLDAQRDQIDADQNQLQSESTVIRDAQVNLEVESERLETLAASLQKQKTSMDASYKDLSAQQKALAAETQAFSDIRKQFESDRDKHIRAVALHDKKEQELHSAENQLNQLALDIEPRQQSLDQREQELEQRAQTLEALASELDERREMLMSMQNELEQNQQTVAVQREELLSRLGSIHHTPAQDIPAATKSIQKEYSNDIEENVQTPSAKPKSAASAAADQFRKLRRDAKRRAIGA